MLVESQRRLPTVDSDLQQYVLELLGKKPSVGDLSVGRVKMTWLRNHFGTIRADADPQTIEQHCRAYILDFFSSCIFAGHTQRTVRITVQGHSPFIASSHHSSASLVPCGIDQIECCVSLGWISMSLLMISR
ncbi:hypothetical protein LINPERHAP2_LOCUS37310 [Linum perenne]